MDVVGVGAFLEGLAQREPHYPTSQIAAQVVVEEVYVSVCVVEGGRGERVARGEEVIEHYFE